MKFPKGLLIEPEDPKPEGAVVTPAETLARNTPETGQRIPHAAAAKPVEKDRLFDTVSHSQTSGKRYVVVLLVVCLAVGAAASAAWYAMRPRVGDRVTAPRGLEMALREHFLEKEKRVATDISFYLCEDSYGAWVGVETRTDIPNPLFRIDRYAATAKQSDGSWAISAKPVPSPQATAPCS